MYVLTQEVGGESLPFMSWPSCGNQKAPCKSTMWVNVLDGARVWQGQAVQRSGKPKDSGVLLWSWGEILLGLALPVAVSPFRLSSDTALGHPCSDP